MQSVEARDRQHTRTRIQLCFPTGLLWEDPRLFSPPTSAFWSTKFFIPFSIHFLTWLISGVQSFRSSPPQRICIRMAGSSCLPFAFVLVPGRRGFIGVIVENCAHLPLGFNHLSCQHGQGILFYQFTFLYCIFTFWARPPIVAHYGYLFWRPGAMRLSLTLLSFKPEKLQYQMYYTWI